jgi:hypothetical protein
MKLFFTVAFLLLFSLPFFSQVVIDGDLTDASYSVLAPAQNNNSGFGSDISVRKIVYFSDVQNGKLYLGVEGKLNTGNSDGIGIFLNFSEVTGLASGSPLGGDPGGHYMGNTGNNNFFADFEVDYMFALNPGGSTTSVYLDAVGLKSGRSAQYIGSSNQSGLTAEGPDLTGLFSQNSIKFAFNNSGSPGKGFEISIPFSELGITSAGNVHGFSFVVSSTAYFSDVTVPGNITSGNPGFNPDFNALPGGPFHSVQAALPVELTSFTASKQGGSILLEWQTAGELNNRGFVVERFSGAGWLEVGFINGNGTTTQKSNYSFTDEVLHYNGVISYRLKQFDHNGSFSYSSVIEINTNPSEYSLYPNFPNPFNPSTIIKYSIAEDDFITLKVFDMLGRETAVLVNEFQQQGEYSYYFNAAGLAAGTYIYMLKGNSYTASGKMMLIK